jgi:cytochrome c oxidase subunit 4
MTIPYVTPATYVKAILVLMVLLIVTVLAANVEMGILNMSIAWPSPYQGVVIMMYFMHLKFSSKLVWIFAGVALFSWASCSRYQRLLYRDWLANRSLTTYKEKSRSSNSMSGFSLCRVQ